MTGTPALTPKPGIYFDMPAEYYHQAGGLSNSMLKQLAISPLRCWHGYFNPAREPRKETDAMKIGTALHTAVLEPGEFNDRYVCGLTEEDFPGCLRTMDDIRKWLQARDIKPPGTAKQPLIDMALSVDPDVKILDVELKRHARENYGKIILDKAEWARVYGMAGALRREPEMGRLLQAGRKEVSIFATEPLTGVLLKCRIDWMTDDLSLDLKSFSSRGDSIDRTVTKAIQYEGYYRQGWFYTHIRKLAGHGDKGWVNAFVESEAPYETRLRSMGPDGWARPNRYWHAAGQEVRILIEKYATYLREFGDSPWVYGQQIVPVRDGEMQKVIWDGEDEEK